MFCCHTEAAAHKGTEGPGVLLTQPAAKPGP